MGGGLDIPVPLSRAAHFYPPDSAGAGVTTHPHPAVAPLPPGLLRISPRGYVWTVSRVAVNRGGRDLALRADAKSRERSERGRLRVALPVYACGRGTVRWLWDRRLPQQGGWTDARRMREGLHFHPAGGGIEVDDLSLAKTSTCDTNRLRGRLEAMQGNARDCKTLRASRWLAISPAKQPCLRCEEVQKVAAGGSGRSRTCFGPTECNRDFDAGQTWLLWVSASGDSCFRLESG